MEWEYKNLDVENWIIKFYLISDKQFALVVTYETS